MRSIDGGDGRGAGRPHFTLTRLLDAPPETVWQLWTDPAELTHWFHPRRTVTPRESISVDLRVGGRYRYTMRDERSGETTELGGVYLEVDEPHRLVFTWGFPDALLDQAPVVTVTLAPRGTRTELTLHVQGIDGRPGADGAHDGWREALDVLADRLTSRRAPDGS